MLHLLSVFEQFDVQFCVEAENVIRAQSPSCDERQFNRGMALEELG